MPFSVTSVATNANGTSADVTISTLPANTSAQVLGISSLGTYVVRATLPTAATGTLVVNDPYVPFGVPVTYRVIAYGTGSGTQTVDAATPYTLNYATALVTDTVTGTSTPVLVGDQSARRYQARSVAYDVIGRTAPVVATQAPQLMEGTIRFRCADLNAKVTLTALLATGNPLVVRTPWHAAVDDVAILPTSWEDDALSPAGGPYWLTVGYNAVDMSAIPYTAGSMTYAKLAAAVSTYANITSLWPTYLKLAAS